MLKGRKVKIRWIKSYPTAHNHIAVGEIIESEQLYLTMHCKTYHFGQSLEGTTGPITPGEYSGGVMEGLPQIRIIPWSRIEVMHLLDDDTEWNVPAVFDTSGNCILKNAHKTLLINSCDKGNQ
jgi:hypothetical protein